MRGKQKKTRGWLARVGWRLLAAALCIPVLFVASVYLGLWGSLPTASELRDIRLDQATEVFSADSVLIGKFFLADRQPVPFAALPEHIAEALVAVEDARFYTHNGVDYQSLGRVFFKTLLLQDDAAGGGSTLSQQLIKNLYPRRKGGSLRLAADKIREMIAARRLEAQYSKDSILSLYLNTVSFGGNRYGIEAAARTFFNTPAARLRPEQAATLVGMLKATSAYNPKNFPARSLARRNLVLRRMAEQGYLEPEVADSLQALPLELDYRPFRHDAGLAPYFREAVRREASRVLESLGPDAPGSLYTSGLKVYTTLNAGLQREAERAMRTHMAALQREFEQAYGSQAPWKASHPTARAILQASEPYRRLLATGLSSAATQDSLSRPREMDLWDWSGEKRRKASVADSILHYAKLLQAGSLALDPADGAVRVWIGGIDFAHFKYDHVSQSRRQVGSTFKPIVYAAALEAGADPCRYYEAREVQYENFEGWTPSNSGEAEEAYMNYSMEEALRHSVNTVAVKVLEETGIPRVVEMAKALGIESEIPEKPSIALGSASIRMTEMAGAYASFLNQGRPVTPYLITSITDREGAALFRASPGEAQPAAFSPRTRSLMLEMLQAVTEDGTAARLRSQYGLKGAIAGKTGTTQQNKDAWFVALTPRLVHVSWVGLNSHRLGFPNTRIGQGAHAALPLFARWYRALGKDPELRALTRGEFPPAEPGTEALLDCPPVKRDGFFKRLFTNPNKTKTRKFRNQDV
ncbi:transglycosylase domain-containing protein [Robiginitalea sp. M366]|uniref:transglycosylase domain-containing protein n=1 Tax=Robiginitalea aestuariiviva TaxID=3036903 RepID=UPI00240D9052|nr:transglycosylase domain-containing protein [Robiginitalea aestuariiviva]MDG1573185.1 transglycosylase domain-containing protein [Robiginitalea aestuariiviva]